MNSDFMAETMVTVDSPGEETCGNARYPSLVTLANDLLQNASIAARDLSYAES